MCMYPSHFLLESLMEPTAPMWTLYIYGTAVGRWGPIHFYSLSLCSLGSPWKCHFLVCTLIQNREDNPEMVLRALHSLFNVFYAGHCCRCWRHIIITANRVKQLIFVLSAFVLKNKRMRDQHRLCQRQWLQNTVQRRQHQRFKSGCLCIRLQIRIYAMPCPRTWRIPIHWEGDTSISRGYWAKPPDWHLIDLWDAFGWMHCPNWESNMHCREFERIWMFYCCDLNGFGESP